VAKQPQTHEEGEAQKLVERIDDGSRAAFFVDDRSGGTSSDGEARAQSVPELTVKVHFFPSRSLSPDSAGSIAARQRRACRKNCGSENARLQQSSLSFKHEGSTHSALLRPRSYRRSAEYTVRQ